MNANNKLHRRYLRRRRKRALVEIMDSKSTAPFRDEYGTLAFLKAFVKVFVCLSLGFLDGENRGKCCFVSYGMHFSIDHYDWVSVWVDPDWLTPWKVTIVNDGV